MTRRARSRDEHHKDVLVTISCAPYGSALWAEGLRLAVGIASVTDDHTVQVALVAQGAFLSLAGLRRSEANRYLATLAECSCRVAVELESLRAAGIEPAEVATDVGIVPRTQLRAWIAAADFVLDM